MNGRMRADRQTPAVNGHRRGENAEAAEAVELATQICDLRQQAEGLRVEIEMAVSALSTVVTNLSAVVTGAVMQLQTIKQRVELLEQPDIPKADSVPERRA